MGGPHRNHGYTVLCRATDDEGLLCRSPVDGGCLRCGVPLCDTHQPDEDVRCGSCESEFATTAPSTHALRRTESRLVTVGGLALGLGVSVLSGLSLSWTASLVLTTVVSGHWFRMMAHLATPGRAGMSSWLLRGRRGRFLRERALPAGRSQNRLA